MIELLWNAPVSETKMMRCIEALDLHDGSRVLDVGCGCGEVLIRLFERHGIHGVGIDSSAEHLAEARHRSRGRVADADVEFVEANAETFQFHAESVDLAICLGATHAFGLGSDAFNNAIEKMKSLVVPGGLLLVADGYLKRTPAPEYRELLGDTMPDDMTHAANVMSGKNAGLIPLAAWTSGEAEWDDFEWKYQRIVERKSAESPDDQSMQANLAARREWMDAYLKWGRDTLGYGTYLFRKP